jgi:hypothetical protein
MLLPRARALLMVVTLAACSHQPGPGVSTADLPWVPFWWVRGTVEAGRFEHLAMVVRIPLHVDAPASWLQLDLGGSGSMPDGFAPPGADPSARHQPGQLHGLLGATAQLELFPSLSDSLRQDWGRQEIGTLGLPGYLSTALVIDFPRQRLAEIPSPTDLASLLGPEFSTIPVQGGYERILFPLAGPSGIPRQAQLDTGLSPFPVWTTRALWQELTGLTEPGATAHRYLLPNPRGRLAFVGAPLRRSLHLGTWKFPRVEVVYLAEGPPGARLEEWTPAVDAVLGPSLFARGAVLAVDLAHRRIGIRGDRQ